MPELPEVETIVRTLRPQVAGRKITGVQVLLPKTLQAGAEFLPLLAGARIAAVRRRAKLALLDLEPANSPPLVAAFHLKMTGSFFVHSPGTAPLKHTRLIFDLTEADAAGTEPQSQPSGRLFFDDTRTFGYCRIMPHESLPLWDFWAKLGPEPLETPAAELAVRLKAGNRAIKAAVLDQTVLAGAGNIYADESLFAAGIAPTARGREISLARLTVLAEALQAVLQKSIEECGSSIRDYRDAQGNAGAFQNCFAVYGRAGQACVRCGMPLQGARVAGRSTVFCPKCQK